MIVLDASAAIDYVIRSGERAEWVRERVVRETDLVAPHIIDLEVVSALRKLVARAEVSRRQAESALADFDDLGVDRYPVTSFLDRIWQLRSVLTPYDAAYVTLGEALDKPLLTTDARLARTHGHRAKIVAYAG